MTYEGKLVYKALLIITLTISIIFSTKKILDTEDKKVINAYSLVDILSLFSIIYLVN